MQAITFQSRPSRKKCNGWTHSVVLAALVLCICSIAFRSVDGTLDLRIQDMNETSDHVNTSSVSILLTPENDITSHALANSTIDTASIGSLDHHGFINQTDSVGIANDLSDVGYSDIKNTSVDDEDITTIGNIASQSSVENLNLSIDDYSHDNVGFAPPIISSASLENGDDAQSLAPDEIIEPSFVVVDPLSVLDDLTSSDEVTLNERKINAEEIGQDSSDEPLVNTVEIDKTIMFPTSDQRLMFDQESSSLSVTNATSDNESSVNAVSDSAVADKPDVADDENHKTVLSVLLSTDDKLDSELCDNVPLIDEDDAHSHQNYHCGIWGAYSTTLRHRRPNLSILRQLFDGDIIIKDDTSSSTGSHDQAAGPDVANTVLGVEQATGFNLDDDSFDPPSMIKTVPNSFRKSDETVESVTTLSSGNDLVSGLDDIDNLFEGVDPPDELDVGTDGASIQEVLIGSATRLVIKRISVAGRFLLRKANQARVFVVLQVGNAAKNSQLLERFRDDDGNWILWESLNDAKNEFVSLQWLRGDDGELIPIQWLESTGWGSAFLEKLRTDNGETFRVSKTRLANIVRSARINALSLYYKVESFFDKIFEGPNIDDEDLDFKFLSDGYFDHIQEGYYPDDSGGTLRKTLDL